MDMNAIASNLNAAGFIVQSRQLKLDKWTSVKLVDNKQNKSGGYIINTQANVCSFINRKTLEKGSFPLDRAKVVSRAEYEKSIRENQKAERDKYFINAQGAAKKYNSLISPDGATSAYLDRKKVQNFGCKIDQKGNLVIPLRSMDIKADGTKVSYIRTLQTIYPDGTKIMEAGCEKKGNMFLIGFNKIFREPEKYTGKILVAEGYATAASLHMATGLPTVVAIDAGNLDPAMSKITKFYNKAEYVICADNDLQTEQRTGRNPGVDAAKACQVKYNCAVVAPDFSKVIGGGNLTDFNDLHVQVGLEGVASRIMQTAEQLYNQKHDKNLLKPEFKYLSATDNLTRSTAAAIVNPVNCVGVMGKGLALQFKEEYPDNYSAYRKACLSGEVTPGSMFLYEEKSGKLIINFPTKDNWQNPSELSYIDKGLDDLVRTIQEKNIKSVAIPAIGCGLGGLDWNVVLPLIESKLIVLKDIELQVYEPDNQRLRFTQNYKLHDYTNNAILENVVDPSAKTVNSIAMQTIEHLSVEKKEESIPRVNLTTNEEVLNYFKPIAPELVSKVMSDGKIDVPGMKGGTCYLQDKIPEYLAELLSVATGHEIINNGKIKDEETNTLTTTYEQKLIR